MSNLDFTPVPVPPRRDGWTPDRQRVFIAALAATRCVAAAAGAVGLSWQAAYELRARPDAASFAAAWDAALVRPTAPDDRIGAVHGLAVPVSYRGSRIGERRRFDDRLGTFLLAIRRPDRFGRTRTPAALGMEDPAAVFSPQSRVWKRTSLPPVRRAIPART